MSLNPAVSLADANLGVDPSRHEGTSATQEDENMKMAQNKGK